MKVLLMPPLTSSEKLWGKYMVEGGLIPPIGILSIASFLESKGHRVQIIDSQVQKTGREELKKILRKEGFGVVGVSAFTNNITDTYFTVSLCKKILPDIKTVVGGIHATILPQRTMEECPEIDFLVIGEGELTMGELLEQLGWRNPNLRIIKGLVFRTKKGKIIVNEKREMIGNLDSLPLPAYHLLDMSRYIPHPTQYKVLPSFPVIAQRGCPFNCAFCGAHFVHGRKTRLKSVENLIKEIELLITRYGAKGIHFQDSSFTIDRKFVINFCREVIKRKLDFKWDINTRVDCVDEEILKLMKAAGLWMINFGLESGNQSSLDLLNKDISLSEGKKAVEMARQIGIVTFSTWILGIPGEDEKMVKKTISFTKEVGTELVLFFLPVPYPGTKLEAICRADGGLRQKAKWEDYSSVDFSRPVYINPLLGEERMKKLLKYAFLSYYFSPKIIIRNLKTIENFEDIKRYWRGLRALFYGWIF